MVNDPAELDFFRGSELIADPYPYYESLRQQCPVTKEKHHDVTMVTGWDEACAVLNDAETWSSCNSVTGPFPGFPVSLEGRGDSDITELIEQHRDELPFSDQLPTLDPPTHTNHRSLLMRLITPKRLKENEDAMWALADQALDDFLAPGHGEFIKGFASPFTLLVIADLLGVPLEDRDKFVKGIRDHSGGGVGGTGKESLAHSPLEFLYGLFSDYVAGPPRRTTRRRADRSRHRHLSRMVRHPRSETWLALRPMSFRRVRKPLFGCLALRCRRWGSGRTFRRSCARTAACCRTSSRSRCATRARSRGTSG